METKLITSLTARTQFGQIKDRAVKNNNRYIVSDRGTASVVILSLEDYLRSIVKMPKIMQELQEEARKNGTDKLTMEEINMEIAEYRKEEKEKKNKKQ